VLFELFKITRRNSHRYYDIDQICYQIMDVMNFGFFFRIIFRSDLYYKELGKNWNLAMARYPRRKLLKNDVSSIPGIILIN